MDINKLLSYTTDEQPTMTGFVHDYCNNFVVTTKRVPTFDE